MTERVVSLSDRGRALEWLSLGFGLWLVASLLVALVLGEAKASTAPELAGLIEPPRALVLAASAGQLVAALAIGLGLAILFRRGQRLWFGFALAALAILLGSAIAAVSLPWLELGDRTPDWNMIYGAGAFAEIGLVALVLLGIRSLAGDDEDNVPVYVLGAAVGAALFRWALVGTFPFDEEMFRWAMLPSNQAALIAVASLASVGLVLLAIRAVSRVVRAQIWAGEPGLTSPARAADWQRTARGLEHFGALLIATIALDASVIPILIITAATGIGGFFTVHLYVLPVASALISAGMVVGLLAARSVPDPPDARAGFTGAALLLAACVAVDLYLVWAGSWQPLAGAILSLGHLVAYLAVLRSLGRIGERLGNDELAGRARGLGLFAALAVGSATAGGYLIMRSLPDFAVDIAAPIVVAAVAFAALLPAALLAREVARTLRRRFAEPPRARASFLQTS